MSKDMKEERVSERIEREKKIMKKDYPMLDVLHDLKNAINRCRKEEPPAIQCQPQLWEITNLDWTLPGNYIGVYLHGIFFGVYNIKTKKLKDFRDL